MPARRLRVAIVGLGSVSIEHLAKLRRLATVEVVAICDLSKTLVEAVGERWGVEGRYVDFDAMLGEVDPQVVHVTTPPASHRQLVLAALDAGAHVFVEKPIAPLLSDYLQMRNTATRRGLLLVENYNYRFTDVVLKALALVREGRIGELVNIDATFATTIADPSGVYRDRSLVHFSHALPGGAVQNFATHPLSLVLPLMVRPTRLACFQRRIAPRGKSNDELRALLDDGRITASITITSHSRPASFAYVLHGTEGRIEVDTTVRRLHLDHAGGSLDTLRNGLCHGLNYGRSTVALAARAAVGRHDYFQGLEILLRRFYAALLSSDPPPISLSEMDDVNYVLHELLGNAAS